MTVVAAPEKPKRIAAVDLWRGAALAAMVIYHGAWDLSLVGLSAEPITDYLGWRLFARSIAATFLVLVGVSLSLASRGPIDWRAYLRRLAFIVGAAALVSLGTYFMMHERFVFFGILHHIAVASVLALPFLRLPLALVLLAAGLVLAAPFFLAGPLFDAPWLWPLGLFLTSPDTVDFVPIFPWFAAVLLGVALGRVLARHAPPALADWRPGNRLSRLFTGAGRWSLPIYLLHQPVLLAFFFGLVTIIGPVPREEVFAGNCRRECAASGRDGPTCEALCSCVLDRSGVEGIREDLLSGRLEASGRGRLSAIVRVCAIEH